MNWEATTLEDLAWWVEQSPAPKRGPGRPAHTWPYQPSERDLDMVEKYKTGQTLVSIGSVYGITRERVRQILKKNGITRMDGGQTISIFRSTPDRIEAKNKQIEKSEAFKRRVWGISLDEWKRIRQEFGYKPFQAYTYQRRNAAKRGIEWEFDFRTWWETWQESGHWPERGRGKGYCMARLGDSGPYSKDNVYFCTIGQNFSDSYITRPASMRRRPINVGRRRVTHCKRGHEYTEENTMTNGKYRTCRQCDRQRGKKYKKKLSDARKALRN